MNAQNKKYLSLLTWVFVLITIGSLIGSLTKAEVSTWYGTLNRSNLTPPNYLFPVAWTLLYGAIGACGWLLWRTPFSSQLSIIKRLYVIQLLVNWSWTPLFFHYHLTGLALMALLVMDVAVAIIVYLSLSKLPKVALLMIPYLSWILFASYLNWYIWYYN